MVSQEQREDIQDATKDLFRDAQWTDGTIEGVEKGAALINRSWYQSSGFILAVVLAVVGQSAQPEGPGHVRQQLLEAQERACGCSSSF